MAETERLNFRAPFEHRPPTLGELLARAWPEGTAEGRERALEQGRVEVDGRIVRAADAEPGAGSRIVAEIEPNLVEYDAPEATALERGDHWVVADKPVGMPGRLDPDDPMHPIFFLADRLGLDRDTFTPAWPMPTTAGGPWLFGPTPADASKLRRRWTRGDLMITWLALLPRPQISQGTLHAPDGRRIQYAATTMRDGLAEIQATLSREGADPPDAFDPAETLREAFADEGSPLLGDRRFGGFMSAGGLRLRLAALFDAETDLQHSWNAPDGWFPDEPVVPPSAEEPEPELPEAIDDLDLPDLTVRASVLDRLRSGGHPWIRPTEIAGRHDHIRPGTIVRVRGTNDVYGPIALVDNRPDVAARVWSDVPLDAVEFEETVELRTDEAVAARGDLIRGATRTDLFRLVHGEADGLPGIAVDRVGPILRAHVQGAAAYAFREELYDALVAYDASTMIIEVEPGKETGRGARVARPGGSYLSPGETVVVREAGLQYRADPWSDRPRIDPSYRTLRRLVRRVAEPGERWIVAASPAAVLPVPLVDAGCDTVRLASEGSPDAIRDSLRLNDASDEALEPESPAALFESLAEENERWDGAIVDLDVGVHALGLETVEGRRRVADDVVRSLQTGAEAILLLRPLPRLEELGTLAGTAESREIELPPDFPQLEGFPEGTPYRGLRLRVGDD